MLYKEYRYQPSPAQPVLDFSHQGRIVYDNYNCAYNCTVPVCSFCWQCCATCNTKAPGIGCYIKFVCVSIILYVDDILLLPSSVTALQQLLRVCKAEFACLDMAVVISACMRIVSRHTVKCMNIRIVSVRETLCCNKIKYLGIDLIAAIVSSNFYMITLNASFV